METFQWDHHFVTGLAQVDDQHRKLVDIINKLSELLTEDVIHIEDVNQIYNELANYAVYHFNEEESFMLEVGVDARHVNSHIDIHKGFLENVSSIYSGISPDNLQHAEFFLKFLIHWLAFHILGQDQDLAKQIKVIQSGVSASEAYEKLEQVRVSATEPLVKALNGLLEHVSMQNRELKQLNESLEEKVVLRTKQLSEANLQLKELSLTDVLTKLPNRRYALQYLSHFWEESLQSYSPLVCLMVDADHFKEVNDTYGHDAGDLVLIELAKALKHSLRNDDVVCRLGGDEFFIICPNTDKKGGMHIAELTRKAISELRVPTGGEPWHGSISIGVASRTSDMKGYEALIKEADKGVYAAKNDGKNCVRSVN